MGLSNANFKFLEDDREYLWKNVRGKFGPKKATQFIGSLEDICSRFVESKKEEDKKSHYEKIKKIVRNFEETKHYLETLGSSKRGGWIPIPPGLRIFKLNFDKFGKTFRLVGYKANLYSLNAQNHEINHSAIINSILIRDDLKTLIRILKDALEVHRPLTGRPKGLLSPFIMLAAEAYEETLGQKANNGGVFLKAIQCSLDSLGMPSKNPRRAINQALKNLK